MFDAFARHSHLMDALFHDVRNVVPAKFGAAAAAFSLLLRPRVLVAFRLHQVIILMSAGLWLSSVIKNAKWRREMSGKRSDGDAETFSECRSRKARRNDERLM
jgi:hypothetical protein